MKHTLLVSALSVALFAGTANALPGGWDLDYMLGPMGTADLWLSAEDGSNTIELEESQTAIIQIWMDYHSAPAIHPARMVGGDVGLTGQLLEQFEVVGFGGPGAGGEYGPWPPPGAVVERPLRVFDRDFLDSNPFDGVPDIVGPGNIEEYFLILGANAPWNDQAGFGPDGGPILLDEIVIHCLGPDPTPARVYFEGPAFYENMFYTSGPYGYAGMVIPELGGAKEPSDPTNPWHWGWREGSFVMGPGSGAKNPLWVIQTIPEPGTLALLALGGLAAIRRRR